MLNYDPIKMQFTLMCDNCGKTYRPNILLPTDTQALRMAQKKGWKFKSDTRGVHHYCPDGISFKEEEKG